MPNIEEKKYEFISTDWVEIIDAEHKKHVLHRIRAIKDFSDVHQGDYGGYIESEENLNQTDNSWVYSDAVRIQNNAKVWGKSRVWGNAKIQNSAEVCDYAIVCDYVIIGDDAKVHGQSIVHGANCCIRGISDISGHADIDGTDRVDINGNVVVKGHVKIEGRVTIEGTVLLDGDTYIHGEHILIGNKSCDDDHVFMRDCVDITDDAHVLDNRDFLTILHLGDSKKPLTSYLTDQNIIMMNTCWFTGSYDDFIEKLNEAYPEGTLIGDEYRLIAQMIKTRFTNNRNQK